MNKVIKTESEHKAALAQIESLMEHDPAQGTAEADRLELLTLLVEQYEAQAYPVRLPDPIEAIKFRMEQQDLQPRDLVRYIGSRSKVSEVLSGKRPLSLSMIRALHSGLGIPAEVLLQQPNADEDPDTAELDELDIQPNRFPLREMIARGWIEAKETLLRDDPRQLLQEFFGPLGSPAVFVALYRKTDHVRSDRPMDEGALITWSAQIVRRALAEPPPGEYIPGSVDAEFLREVARLSLFEQGPILAQEFLGKHGISLIIEPPLPRTYLDGAAILFHSKTPVIGLSLRHDRIDNFWFCLMHELAHIALHFSEGNVQFLDDLDAGTQGDPREEEADRLAGEVLIPKEIWHSEPARVTKAQQAVERFANKLKIHPAIVAGRIRHESNSYHLLKHMVGYGEVRRLFPNIEWK